MNDDIIHQRESKNEMETESFLQENISQFQSDAVFLLQLMMRGERLTAKTVVQKYGKESRRLRDLHAEGKCEKVWVLNDKGKRLYVEYFVTTPHPSTKHEVIERSAKVIDMMKRIPEKVFVTVISDYPDDPPQPPRYTEQSLFP